MGFTYNTYLLISEDTDTKEKLIIRLKLLREGDIKYFN